MANGIHGFTICSLQFNFNLKLSQTLILQRGQEKKIDITERGKHNRQKTVNTEKYPFYPH